MPRYAVFSNISPLHPATNPTIAGMGEGPKETRHFPGCLGGLHDAQLYYLMLFRPYSSMLVNKPPPPAGGGGCELDEGLTLRRGQHAKEHLRVVSCGCEVTNWRSGSRDGVAYIAPPTAERTNGLNLIGFPGLGVEGHLSSGVDMDVAIR